MTEEYMTPDELAEFSEYIRMDSDEIEFSVIRDSDDEFGEAKMDRLFSDIRTFIAARMMSGWPLTGEPPAKLTVKISVEVS